LSILIQASDVAHDAALAHLPPWNERLFEELWPETGRADKIRPTSGTRGEMGSSIFYIHSAREEAQGLRCVWVNEQYLNYALIIGKNRDAIGRNVVASMIESSRPNMLTTTGSHGPTAIQDEENIYSVAFI
jgi:hypothetical protein